MSATFGWFLALAQAVLGLRVAWRPLHTGRDAPICPPATGDIPTASIAIVVPVLNEVHRLSRCLQGVVAQGAEVGDILVVDSGSDDGTPELVRQFARYDSRVHLLEAGPAPPDWNGKVWGLHRGERALSSGSKWVLVLDADVAPSPLLARSLVSRAASRDLRMLSVATRQEVSGVLQGILHPAMLASLVYRFGRPNGATSSAGGGARRLLRGRRPRPHRDVRRLA